MKKIFLLFLCTLTLSCLKDETADYTAQNEEEIQAYLNENNLDFQKTSSGLYYDIKSPGSGSSPIFSSIITAGYKGYFLDGTVFDQSSEANFSLGGVVFGFGEALSLLKPGGSGTFILPSRLAYGTRGSGAIKPGDVIAFDINLISVE
jgi:FKBP-type peptidyl-prolyl cis-trans isomerase FkpA